MCSDGLSILEKDSSYRYKSSYILGSWTLEDIFAIQEAAMKKKLRKKRAKHTAAVNNGNSEHLLIRLTMICPTKVTLQRFRCDGCMKECERCDIDRKMFRNSQWLAKLRIVFKVVRIVLETILGSFLGKLFWCLRCRSRFMCELVMEMLTCEQVKTHLNEKRKSSL
eukprot:TRINITY_DN2014_c0_g4_i1.p1 TRINITY_DN2014_c0_g4~~TRINITY_DN2014_c0_g4_i1.p1  ORF type:complete len:166 (-),score=15.86 TRINITY_DN2014_c0_g4_i1:91-588(-)